MYKNSTRSSRTDTRCPRSAVIGKDTLPEGSRRRLLILSPQQNCPTIKPTSIPPCAKFLLPLLSGPGFKCSYAFFLVLIGLLCLWFPRSRNRMIYQWTDPKVCFTLWTKSLKYQTLRAGLKSTASAKPTHGGGVNLALSPSRTTLRRAKGGFCPENPLDLGLIKESREDAFGVHSAVLANSPASSLGSE